MAVQSKCTISHLEGLKAILSAYSMPSIKVRNSGQTNAEPAQAASTCSHISSSLPENFQLKHEFPGIFLSECTIKILEKAQQKIWTSRSLPRDRLGCVISGTSIIGLNVPCITQPFTRFPQFQRFLLCLVCILPSDQYKEKLSVYCRNTYKTNAQALYKSHEEFFCINTQ